MMNVLSSSKISQESNAKGQKPSKLGSVVDWVIPGKTSDLSQSQKVTFKSETPIQSRLPLCGPLNVKHIHDFNNQARERFEKLYLTKDYNLVNREHFEMLTVLGKGAFGKVILVRDKKDKQFYAMKALEKRHICKMNQVPHVLNEKRVLQCIDFPFTVRMEFFSKDNSYIYFFLPFISGGEMFNHLQRFKKFSEPQSRFYAAQVVLALEHLHFMKLVYRDLKPENLLLDHNGYLKITDFGFCKHVPTRTYTFCGTPQYLAPEIITGHGYGLSCDWWSLGVLIYEMNAGYPPFDCEDQMAMFRLILAGRYSIPPTFPPLVKDIISKLLQTDVTRRYGALHRGAEIIKNHEWFKPINWLDVFNRRVAAPFVPPTSGSGDVTHFPHNDRVSLLHTSEKNEFEEEFKDF